MSTLVRRLIDTARADMELLATNQGLGDELSATREVEFFLYARSAKRAELVASFINDLRYGDAAAERSQGRHLIRVIVRMPITQAVLGSVSAFFVCLSTIYNLNYDGWVSAIQQRRRAARRRPRR